MFRPLVKIVLLIAAAISVPAAHASLIRLGTTLSGANENPMIVSPGTGSVEVDIDNVANLLSIHLVFSGLTSPTVFAHLHCCAPAPMNSGVATAPFASFPLGTTNATYDSVNFDLTQLAFYNPPFVAANGGTAASAEAALLAGLLAGQSYFNIHTVNNRGGEVRGFLHAVPEPWSLSLLGIGLSAFGWSSRRKRGVPR